LTQEEQKHASIFLHDIERGDVTVEEGKTLRDYITEYQAKAKRDKIHRVSDAFGMDETKLQYMMSLKLNMDNINEYGRFDSLKNTVDKKKAKVFFEKQNGTVLPPPKVNMQVDEFLRDLLVKEDTDLE
jgi:type I restriction enzyme R subunit